MKDFLPNKTYNLYNVVSVQTCPSNIALIKYWGKFEGQIPANPSISYTLNNCRTNTEMEFFADEKFSVQTFLGGNEELKFASKIEKLFKSIPKPLTCTLTSNHIIRPANTLPHRSRIASPPSGFRAIAKCLMDLDEKFSAAETNEFRLKKAGVLARLGSGSACRSLYDGL